MSAIRSVYMRQLSLGCSKSLVCTFGPEPQRKHQQKLITTQAQVRIRYHNPWPTWFAPHTAGRIERLIDHHRKEYCQRDEITTTQAAVVCSSHLCRANMEGGGFFRVRTRRLCSSGDALSSLTQGTSAEQDSRFGDKMKKLIGATKFPPEFDEKVRVNCSSWPFMDVTSSGGHEESQL
jgi:hypothetical protein